MSHEETVFTQRSNTRIPAGMVLNNTFQVDSWISSGGMGEIYKGHSVQTGDLVAIKLIRPEMAENDTVLALFRKEASVLHNLLHEAIVRYYVFSEDPTLRRPYLVMEFVDGPSLADMIRADPLPYESVRVLQRRLATALQSAHELGIVHRDISPDNVILPASDVKRAKIIDFGIAKAANIGDTIIGGGFAGKHKYVSPEQLGLFGGDVTPKSDTYSLGLVLAEALTGHAADMGNTQVEMVERRRELPDLSRVDARVRPLIERMVQPRPADRPTMAEVAEWNPVGDTGAATLATRSPSKPERRRSFSARLGFVVALAGLVVVAVLALNYGLNQTPTGHPEDGLSAGTTTTIPPLPPAPLPSGQGDAPPEPQVTPAPAPAPGPTPVSPALPETPSPTTPVAPAPSPPVAATETPTALSPSALSEIDALLKALPCARVAALAREQDGTVELAGHLKSDVDQADLVARIKAVPGVTSVGTSELIVGGDHYCSVLATLARAGMTRIAGQGERPDLIGYPAQAGVLRLSKGTPIELQSKTPDFPAFVYVDYYSTDGNVFHLLPSGDFGRETSPPGTQVSIGHPGDPGPQARVAPPFGLDMVVVLDSSTRLFDKERPAAEPADAYLADLKAAIDGAAGGGSMKLAYEYQLIFTSEIGGQ